MDDYSVIVSNPDIRSLHNFWLNTLPGRPLRELTYMLDYKLFGLDPWGYHFQNIFWHALNCYLVYKFARKHLMSNRAAWFAALLFLVHPIHVEVVANSSHRKDSLALAFILLALLAYTRVINAAHQLRKKIFWLTATALMWLIAFLAKGNAVMLPALLAAYELTLVPHDKRFIFRSRYVLPIAAGGAVAGVTAWYWYIWSTPSFGMMIMTAFLKMESVAEFSTAAYIRAVVKSMAFIFSKWFFPANLSMEYIYSVPKSFGDVWIIASVLFVGSCCVVTYRWWKSGHSLQLYLLMFVVVMWLPTSNIFWHFSYFAADRYLYASSAGLCLLLATIVERVAEKNRVSWYIAWLCILICAGLTWKQSGVWKNPEVFYRHMLKVSPRSLEAMVGLSAAYYEEKKYQAAAEYARMAIQRDPTDYRPYLTLGYISYMNRQLDDALALAVEAQKKNTLAPDVANLLGSIYDDLGKPELAVASFRNALRLLPGYFQASTNLGVALERSAKLDDAEQALRDALKVNKQYVPAWHNLGIVLYRKNNKSGAKQAFSEAVALDPQHSDALTNLSVVCNELHDTACYDDAVARLKALKPAVPAQ